ncbi:MAG: 1-(5-phosphoribosyl)-5-[(5-phosphoribosylamino)methylideneamino]imidazole-4-carboxamide isomerase [Oscillospiraceae bacterium]
MIILPAIDIKDKKCVRLLKGDFATVHKVAEDPIKTAQGFKSLGATWIHTVDLDGAKDGSSKNFPIFEEIKEKTGAFVELGGGIRDMKTAEKYISSGIDRLILGSVAVSNPDFVREAVKEFGEKIAVGIDALDGFVRTDGWVKNSKIGYIDLAKKMEDMGVRFIIYTDISRDGTLGGCSLNQLDEINNAVSSNIIASGGVKSIDDIKSLKELNLYGAICGKAIYEGTLDLGEALKINS